MKSADTASTIGARYPTQRRNSSSKTVSIELALCWSVSLTVGAVYDRAFVADSTKYARSQTAPTVSRLPRKAAHAASWLVYLSSISSMLKDAAFCLGGNALNVS